MAPYRTLKAWQHAQRLAVECAKAAQRFPEYEQSALADQLRRAAYGVVMNIAEGSERRGTREYRRFLDTANASLAEVETALGLARDHLPPQRWTALGVWASRRLPWRLGVSGLHGIRQGVPGQERALDAHRELGHAGESPQVAEGLVAGGRGVALQHRAHALGERQRLRHRLVLEELSHHRRRRLTDGAPAADKARLLDHVTVHAQLQVDLVPTQRVVQRDRVRGRLERALVAGPPVVVEDELLVEGAEPGLRRGRIQTGLLL